MCSEPTVLPVLSARRAQGRVGGPGLESLLSRAGPSARCPPCSRSAPARAALPARSSSPPGLFAVSHIVALLARPLQEDPASLAPTAVPLLLTLVRVHTGVLESLVLLDLRPH